MVERLNRNDTMLEIALETVLKHCFPKINIHSLTIKDGNGLIEFEDEGLYTRKEILSKVEEIKTTTVPIIDLLKNPIKLPK